MAEQTADEIRVDQVGPNQKGRNTTKNAHENIRAEYYKLLLRALKYILLLPKSRKSSLLQIEAWKS